MTPFRLVLAGTGTDVGKTTLGVRLASALRRSGHVVLAVKPIETGYSDAGASDAAQLSSAAEHPFVPPAVTSPEPVAPMRARLSPPGPVDLYSISVWLRRLEEELRPQVTVIETAGGLFTPLSRARTNLDLLQALSPDTWFLVARDRLGVLHDCIATVTAARASHCSPEAVILGTRDVSAPANNADDIAAYLALPVYDAGSDVSYARLVASIDDRVAPRS